jgi:hypothetical protein
MGGTFHASPSIAQGIGIACLAAVAALLARAGKGPGKQLFGGRAA